MDVMILGSIPQSGISLLQERPGTQVHSVDPGDTAAVSELIGLVSGIIIRTSLLERDLIARAGKLKIVSRFGVGYDNIDVEELTRRSIPLAVVGQTNAVSVAEHTLYLMLAAAKMGIAYDRAARSGRWGYRDSLAATELGGKVLLVIGMGRIGSMVARYAEALGMTVSYYDPQIDLSASHPAWLKVGALHEGLAGADVVSVNVPLVDATRNLLGAREFRCMKRSAVIVSTSRGGIVNEADLAAALVDGTIRAAGLDVFEIEPVPPDNPLLALENVVLSPHMAALSLECAERMSVAAARNCLAGLDGNLDPALVVNAQVLRARALAEE